MARIVSAVLTGTLASALAGGALVAPAAASPFYGAFAYSPSTGHYGYAFNYSIRDLAQSEALIACESNARRGDCQLLFWFGNGCGTLVRDGRSALQGATLGTGWGDTPNQANAQALQDCSARGGQACTVLETVCTAR